MGGPWEKFAHAATPAASASGPWTKFASAAPAAAPEQPGIMSKIGTKLANAFEAHGREMAAPPQPLKIDPAAEMESVLNGTARGTAGLGQLAATALPENIAKPVNNFLGESVKGMNDRQKQLNDRSSHAETISNLSTAIPITAAATAALPAATEMTAAQLLTSGGLTNAALGMSKPTETGEEYNRFDPGRVAVDTAVGVGSVAIPVVAMKAIQSSGGFKNFIQQAMRDKDSFDILSDIIKKSGLTPEDALAKIQAGQITTLADVGGDTTAGATRAIAKVGDAKNVVQQELENRSLDAVKRVSNDLTNHVSSVDRYFGNLDDLQSAYREKAAPLYRDAFTQNKSINSKVVDRILETPAGKKALGHAAESMQNDMALMGTPDAELGEQARLAGQRVEGGVANGLNLRTLDYVKKGLDDQINIAQRAGENQRAASLINMKNQLVAELDAADVTGRAGPNSFKPEGGSYANARKVASDAFKLRDAQETGRKFSTMTPEQLQMAMKDMNDAEKDAFRIGVRENLQNSVNATSDGADPAKRIFGNTQKREQLKAVFGGEDFDKFEARMREEMQAANTKFKVLGGSRTDYNIAEDANSAAGDLIENVATKGPTRAAVDAGVQKVADYVRKSGLGVNEKNSVELARMLVNRGQSIESLNEIIRRNSGATPAQNIAAALSEPLFQKGTPAAAPSPAEALSGAPATMDENLGQRISRSPIGKVLGNRRGSIDLDALEQSVKTAREKVTEALSKKNIDDAQKIATKYQNRFGEDSSFMVDEKNNLIKIEAIEVPENLRKKGIGTSFIKELTNYADNNGKKIILDLDSTETPKKVLEKFYSQNGFKPTGENKWSWSRNPNLSMDQASRMARAQADFTDGSIWNKKSIYDPYNVELDDSGITLYHVTSKDAANSIQKEGFKAGKPNQFQGYESAHQGVYGWTNRDRAVAEAQRMYENAPENLNDIAIVKYKIPREKFDNLRADEDSGTSDWVESMKGGSVAYSGDLPEQTIQEIITHSKRGSKIAGVTPLVGGASVAAALSGLTKGNSK